MEKHVDAQWFCNQFQFKIWWEGFEDNNNTKTLWQKVVVR